ncbi:MAG TPA: hypothetical protein VFK80_11115 [Limnochordia bacterium]|nr:hypothetical protein [Limnochordia bacterium]
MRFVVLLCALLLLPGCRTAPSEPGTLTSSGQTLYVKGTTPSVTGKDGLTPEVRRLVRALWSQGVQAGDKMQPKPQYVSASVNDAGGDLWQFALDWPDAQRARYFWVTDADLFKDTAIFFAPQIDRRLVDAVQVWFDGLHSHNLAAMYALFADPAHGGPGGFWLALYLRSLDYRYKDVDVQLGRIMLQQQTVPRSIDEGPPEPSARWFARARYHIHGTIRRQALTADGHLQLDENGDTIWYDETIDRDEEGWFEFTAVGGLPMLVAAANEWDDDFAAAAGAVPAAWAAPVLAPIDVPNSPLRPQDFAVTAASEEVGADARQNQMLIGPMASYDAAAGVERVALVFTGVPDINACRLVLRDYITAIHRWLQKEHTTVDRLVVGDNLMIWTQAMIDDAAQHPGRFMQLLGDAVRATLQTTTTPSQPR